MKILKWDNPSKIMFIKEWKNISADSAAPGVYVPNMSNDDIWKWKAKLKGHKSNHPQVEIRWGTTIIIVHNGAYKYKHYDTRDKNIRPGLHIASAGPFIMNEDEFNDFLQAVSEAREVLKEYSE